MIRCIQRSTGEVTYVTPEFFIKNFFTSNLDYWSPKNNKCMQDNVTLLIKDLGEEGLKYFLLFLCLYSKVIPIGLRMEMLSEILNEY